MYFKIVIKTFFFSILFLSCNNEEKKIAYINSYHKGYPPSDEISKAIQTLLDSAGYKLLTWYIDSKRIVSQERLSEKIDSIRNEIKLYDPDLIIASDDYAVKYIIKPYYSDKSAPPVVFCGVNWSAAEYDLRSPFITGILEVLPLRESLKFFKTIYPEAKKLAVVSENSLSEQKNTELLDSLYKNMGFVVDYYLADTFEEWKELFSKANNETDIIYLPTNGSIKGWIDTEAKTFVSVNIHKPVFTCDDFMMPYCVAGFTKVASEQGEWAAETAIAIIGGKRPSDIQVSYNKKFKIWFNPELAAKIGFSPDSGWIKKASINIYD